MNADPKIEAIFTTVEQLREAAGDGPATRKLLDTLFRQTHNLKANASANGLNDLAAAAHEFENVLHALRACKQTADAVESDAIPADVWNSLKQEQKETVRQSLAEGAQIFVVQKDFDVADFDRQFKGLKESLSKNGEVISTSPSLDSARPGKVNFRILYARAGEAKQTFLEPSDMQTFERSFEKLTAELANARMLSVGDVLQQAVRGGELAAVATGKEVEFELRGQDLLQDQALCELLADPLLHLVRNAVAHGIEASDERVRVGKPARGKIVIEVERLNDQTTVTVTDDGRGIDPDVLSLIFSSGFSTAAEVSEISGRGVGLDVVKTTIENACGSVNVTSQPGKGSSFKLTIPD